MALPSPIGIYGPKHSAKTSLLEKLREKGVPENMVQEYDHETLPQPGHGAIIIMCTRSPKYWVEFMNAAAEIYPLNFILPIVACADKDTINERLAVAPCGALAVDARPKTVNGNINKLVLWLTSTDPIGHINTQIDEAYQAEREKEEAAKKREAARQKRQEKKSRKSTPDEDGWFQV